MAVVHHGLPIRPVPAIHLQAPAAPFQSPVGVWSPLEPHTQPGHQPLALPPGCGCHPCRDQGTTANGGDAAACRAGRAGLSIHRVDPLAEHHMAQPQGCWTRRGQRRLSSCWVCPMELPGAWHWGRRVLGGSQEAAAPLPDVALDAALAPDLVLYQVGVVGGGDEVVAERLAHVLPQCPVPGVEDGALRGAEVHEEPVGTQCMASPGCG